MSLRHFFVESFFQGRKEEKDEKGQVIDKQAEFLNQLYQGKKPYYFSHWIEKHCSSTGKVDYIQQMKNFRNVKDNKYTPDFLILKQQIQKVLDEIIAWCETQQWDTDKVKDSDIKKRLKNQFNDLASDEEKDSLFDPFYVSESTAIQFYSEGKKYFETLLYEITRPDANKDLAKAVITNFARKIGVCSPGLFIDLEDAYFRFSKDISALYKAKRLETIQQAAIHYAGKLKEKPDKGNEIHFVTALTNFVSDDYGIVFRKDEFAHAAFSLESDILEICNGFKQYLEAPWVTKLFLEKLVDQYIQDVSIIKTAHSITLFEKKLDEIAKDEFLVTSSIFGPYKEKIDPETQKSIWVDNSDDDDYMHYGPKDQIMDLSHENMLASSHQIRKQLKKTLLFRLINSKVVNVDALVRIKFGDYIFYLNPFSAALSWVTKEKTDSEIEKKESKIATPLITREANRLLLIDYLNEVLKEADTDIQAAFIKKLLAVAGNIDMKNIFVFCFLYLHPSIMALVYASGALDRKTVDLFILNNLANDNVWIFFRGYYGHETSKKYSALAQLLLRNQARLKEINIESYKRVMRNIEFNSAHLILCLRLNGINNFAGADFSGIEFKGINPGELRLKGVKLDIIAFQSLLSISEKNFRNSDLSGIDFTKLNLLNLDGCDFSDADLTNVNLANLDLFNCNFTGANFKNANLSRTIFRHCRNCTFNIKSLSTLLDTVQDRYLLIEIRFNDMPSEVKAEDLSKISLKGYKIGATMIKRLYQCGLRDFSGLAGIFNANELSHFHFINADFSDSRIYSFDFRYSDLRGTSFKNADITIFIDDMKKEVEQFKGTVYADIPPKLIDKYIKFVDGRNSLSLCETLLRDKLSKKSKWNETRALFGLGYAKQITAALSKFHEFKSMEDVKKCLAPCLKAKSGSLFEIITFCSIMERNEQLLAKQNNEYKVERDDKPVSSASSSLSAGSS